MSTFSSLYALVVDDAPVVIATLRVMLRKMGLQDDNIHTAKDARSALLLARHRPYDIAICDYNFGGGLNGKQIFEELSHGNLLAKGAVFIMVTGEASGPIVRSIIELEPDEYLLKPYTEKNLHDRLRMAIRRKQALLAIYAAEQERNPAAGLEACDELEGRYPLYSALIKRFRGQFLRDLARAEEARDLYESILRTDNYEWAQLGLGNSLVDLGDFEGAEKCFASLLAQPVVSVATLNAVSRFELYREDIPAAIRHVTMASELVPGHAERELLLANLCLVEGDYANAAKKYQLYHEVNRETFRDTLACRLNWLRGMAWQLSDCTDVREKAKLRNEIQYHLGQFYRLEPSPALNGQLSLIACHLALCDNDLPILMSLLKSGLTMVADFDFYARYHLCYLLSELMIDAELPHHLQHAGSQVLTSGSDVISKSQLLMLKRLKDRHQERRAFLANAYQSASDALQQKRFMVAMDIYLNVQEKMPYVYRTSLRIMKLLSVIWPTGLGVDAVRALIVRSDLVIREMLTEEALLNLQYPEIYRRACAHVNHHAGAKRGQDTT